MDSRVGVPIAHPQTARSVGSRPVAIWYADSTNSGSGASTDSCVSLDSLYARVDTTYMKTTDQMTKDERIELFRQRCNEWAKAKPVVTFGSKGSERLTEADRIK